MQSETLSGIVCTNTMDKMTKDCDIPALKYQNVVEIPKLGYIDDVVDITECGIETKTMNNYTTQEIRRRKLQVSADKCARMHIGKKKKEEVTSKQKCHEVNIDVWEEKKVKKGEEMVLEDQFKGQEEIKEVEEYEYLGDIVASDGTHSKNIKKRASKGYGVIRDIKEILEGTFFGSFFIEALILLRNSMLTSVLTYNLEVSSKISKKDIKLLDDVDMRLLRDCLSLSSKTSRTLILAELGIMSIEAIIKQKRINYLNHLLTSDDENLAKQVLLQQVENTQRNDWVEVVKSDMEEANIQFNVEQISNTSKLTFKKMVKERSQAAFLNQLNKEKLKLSKGNNLNYPQLKLQSYLKSDSNLTSETMKRILKVRLRDIPVKCNFPGAFSDNKCVAAPLCDKSESNEHLFSCEYLAAGNEMAENNIKHEHISQYNVLKT